METHETYLNLFQWRIMENQNHAESWTIMENHEGKSRKSGKSGKIRKNQES